MTGIGGPASAPAQEKSISQDARNKNNYDLHHDEKINKYEAC
jgi:hypothetical protein